MSETASFTTPPESGAYDEHLYPAYAEIASFQAFEYLKGDGPYRKEQKRRFLAGEFRNPTLDYPLIDNNRIDRIEEELLSQKQRIVSEEENEAVKQAYRWRINEKIAEARLLRAVANGDLRRFQRYSEFIYGNPSVEIFNYTVNWLRTRAEEARGSDNLDLQTSATALLEALPEVEEAGVYELPNQTQLEAAHEQTISEFSDLINIPSNGEVDARQISEAFKQALQQIGDEDWAVAVEDNSTNISLNHEKKNVIIPEDRKVDRQKLEQLIVHEIGTHVARRRNGERSRLKLLSLGLDRYDPGEEGVTTLREQAIAKEMEDFAGLPGYLAIGLAAGLDGQPRDFRGVYDVLEKYFTFTVVQEGKTVTEAQEKAKNKAWNRTIRTFRGTDCKTPGVYFGRDLVYRKGNIGIWELVRTDPAEMLRFNIGKYDPTNSRHIWILEQLGITDEDLARLEEQ